MTAENSTLVQLIREEIGSLGPISFARFMEQALYHPDHGYYAGGRASLGRAGDYFTNVSVGPAFGELLALQFCEIWRVLDRPANFQLLEQGSHHGELAGDVLRALRASAPEFFKATQLKLIEPFPGLEKRQREMLAEFGGKVEWRKSIAELDPFTGIHFSNELFDALPVHLVVSTGGEDRWEEKCVDLNEEQFVFVTRPIKDQALSEYAAALLPRPAGYATEVNLAAPRLLEAISKKLICGFVIAIDYGFSRAAYYDEERSCGTLQCRRQHRIVESPLLGLGETDITAHLDWTSFVQKAESCGFSLAGFTDQHHFLTGLLAAFPEFAENSTAKSRRALQTLLHPEMLGRSFQVMALAKAVDPLSPLSGFQFTRDPWS